MTPLPAQHPGPTGNSVDLVLRGGTVADGTGGELFEADVAVHGGRIVQLGKVTARGREEIDARGKLVTPGFVDVHSHFDGQAIWSQRLAPSSWHGVTTTVMGNCGVGFAPVRDTDHDCLIELMEGVEDVPGVVMREGLEWSWGSYADYLDALERKPHDIDFCSQLPHAPLRTFVMGERAIRLEPATEDDVAAMRRLTRDAMRAGAIGFSTSRSILHKTSTGAPMPTLRATERELMGIALGMQDAGSGVIGYRTDFDTEALRLEEFEIMRRLVSTSGRPLSVSLFQENKAPQGWRHLLDLVEGAHAEGLPLRAQVAPRQLGVLLGLQSSQNPFSENASYKPISKKPLAERLTTLRDASFRARLLGEERPLQRRLENMYRMGSDFDYHLPPEAALPAIAAREGRSAAEVAYDLLLQDEGRNFIYHAAANYADGNFDACRAMLASPATVPGLGDSGAHVTMIVDASFPTYFLAYWARDRGPDAFSLPWAVRRLTADCAHAMGLTDRGVLAPGKKADINVIDFDALTWQRPYMSFDLPAGGARLLQGARGYAATIVCGEVVYRDGQATGALPGRLVRSRAVSS